LLRKQQKTLGGYFFAAPCRIEATAVLPDSYYFRCIDVFRPPTMHPAIARVMQ